MNESLSGKTLGEFQILSEIGQGGMAVTYRAYQPTMDRKVAVKVIRPQLAAHPDFVARFLQEVRIIAQLEHPRILPVYAAGQSDGITYLVMRLIEGGTLRDLTRRKPLKHKEINRFIGQMASALDYAHRRGVLHLDLKPTNVLVDLNWEAYLSDFGIARLMASDGSLRLDRPVGTPEYMSPEQCAGDTVDARSDVYSLGVVLYELLAAKLPYRGETAEAICQQHLRAALPVPSDLSPPLRSILLKALAKRKEERFASAGALAAALTAAIAGLPIPADDSPLPQDEPPTLIGEALPAEAATVPHRRQLRAEAGPPQATRKRDATWFCGLCGTSLEGLPEGEPCPTCNSTRVLRKPQV